MRRTTKNILGIGIIFIVIIGIGVVFSNINNKQKDGQAEMETGSESKIENAPDQIVDVDTHADGVTVEVKFEDDFDFSEIGKTMEEINQLNVYRTEYEETDAEKENQIRQDLGENGQLMNYDNSFQFVCEESIDGNETQEEKALNYIELAEKYFEKVPTGMENMTYKSWAVNSETVKDIGVDAMIFMRPYIDGIPFTEKAVNNGCQDEIGRYEYYNMENNISFRGGRVCNMSWFRRQNILEKKTIEKQYHSFEDFYAILDGIQAMWGSDAGDNYTCYLISDAAIEYVQMKDTENPAAEQWIVPLLTLNGYSQSVIDGQMSGVQKNSLLMNLNDGHIYEGMVRDADLSHEE